MATFVRSLRVPAFLVGSIALLWAVVPAPQATAQPTVNGLFYGDGDDALYEPYSTSEYGSVLYSYLDIPTLTLYVALVVDHSVNDMVCSSNKPYTQSTGWNPPRSCKRATDSEFAAFSLECAPGSPNAWVWQQALGCPTNLADPESDWVADPTCGPSSPAADWPPSIVASSSWVTNVNTYQDAAPATRAWDMYVNGLDYTRWKSPFLASAPNDATAVPGYPTYSDTDPNSGLAYEWEWSMIYEWSVILGSNGADCGSEAIFFVTGNSHHSPSKVGDENDDFPPPENPRLSDWGDNPDTYGTTAASGGAQHFIKVTGPYLGSALQVENDGVPTADATGDGDEEDGVTAVIDENWTAGSTQEIEVVVGNADSGAVLAGWFDWNDDGDFNDPGEYVTWNVTTGTNTLSLTVGSGFDWQTDDLYTRFRIFSSGATAPGGSLTQADSVGTADDGEVEDFFFEAGSLPVTLAAWESERAGGELTVRWQTASETDNVGFEVWGLVRGEWQPVTDLVPSREMTSGLPQDYEVRFQAPDGLAALELVDYDSRGRTERFGQFRLDARYGEFQPRQEIDWRGPQEERDRLLRHQGFADTAATPKIAERPSGNAGTSDISNVVGRALKEPSVSDNPVGQEGLRLNLDSNPGETHGAPRWKKVRAGGTTPDLAAKASQVSVTVGRALKEPSVSDNPVGLAEVRVSLGATTHIAVTEDGIQRVTYEALRDGGLDLAGVRVQDIAVTFRGEPVARWIDGRGKFGPGDALEFLGTAPSGDDALYIDTYLYQVSVDADSARKARALGPSKARRLSPQYARTVASDPPLLYRHQSPTGDPWVARSVLVRPGAGTEVLLDLPVDGPVADGAGRLRVGLGAMTDLEDLRDGSGAVIPEHNVEVSFRGPGGSFQPLITSSTSGYGNWSLEADLPNGAVSSGLHQVRLHFTTDYFFSLVVVDDYSLALNSPYRGPSLNFEADPSAQGYHVEGFTSPEVSAYATDRDGSLTRLTPRVEGQPGGEYSAELRRLIAGQHAWVTDAPHQPQVFTTEAPAGDLLAGPAELVIVAGSSFVGSPALADYVAQHADLDPVVVDVEDIYNATGYGMALPSAITDYLAARDAVHPFSHVQLVGADCYDRLNYVSSCLSFVPLPTAQVGVSAFAPSQNRLVDLDGDGVGDKAVAQFSVRGEAELATIVAKGDAWASSGLGATESALLIAEESDGLNNFAGQVARLASHLGWDDSTLLDLADHPDIRTARQEMGDALQAGRSLTLYSGHSSPTVWSFRGLMTTSTVASLGNEGQPTLMVPLACETTYDISPNANVLGHRLLYEGAGGALAVSGAVALSSLQENERMARQVLSGLDAGMTLGEAVQAGREALGANHQELLDNWLTQGDVAVELR